MKRVFALNDFGALLSYDVPNAKVQNKSASEQSDELWQTTARTVAFWQIF
ncbi:hypothetical protein [Vibrio coralliilyticus]